MRHKAVAAGRNPGGTPYRHARMQTWDQLLAAAEAHAAAGRFAAARDAAGAALDAARGGGAAPIDQARCALLLGRARRELAAYAEAEQACREAVALSAGDTTTTRVAALAELAHTLVGAGRAAEAEPFLEDAVARADPDADDAAAWALRVFAEVRIGQARYADAEQLALRAHATLLRLHGDRHPRTAHALTTAANPALHLDRLDDAEQRMRSALATREQVLPPLHPHRAEALHNLAGLALARARLDEAEQLEGEAVRIWEASLGPEHPTLAVALGNLGAVANKRGRYAEAEAFYRRGLRIREANLGPDHPRVATSLNNLAAVLDKRGNNAEAEQLFLRSLAIAEKAHGPVHPDVARALNNLFGVKRRQGDEEAADAYLLRAIAVWEECLPDSRELAVSLSNLAVRQRARGEEGEAESTLLRVLATTQRRAGRDHPDLSTPLNNLADLYLSAGRLDEAQTLFLRALRLREQAGYRPSPQTMGNLALVAFRQDRLDDSLTWLQRGVAVVEEDVGPDSPDLLPLLVQRARVERRLGDHAGAVGTLQRVVGIRERQRGPEHPDLATTLTSLGAALKAAGDPGAAEQAWRRGVAILDAAGPPSVRLAELLILLGHRLVESDRAAEAVGLLRRAVEICTAERGPGHQLTASALTWLGYAEIATGDGAAAEEHLRAALDIRGDAVDTRAGATIALHGLRRAYQDPERAEDLTAVLQRLLSLREQAGRPDGELDRLLRELADLHYHAGRWAEAVPLYERVLAATPPAERQPMFRAATRFCLAICLANLGRDDDADRHMAEASRLSRESGDGHVADALHCLCTWVDFRRARGRLAQAAELRPEIAALLDRPGTEPHLAARGHEALGRLDAATGRWADAAADFAAAVAAWERSDRPEARGAAVAGRYELARLAHLRGLAGEAAAAYTALAAELEALGPSAGPALVRVLHDHARLLDESGAPAEAAGLRERAEQVASQLG